MYRSPYIYSPENFKILPKNFRTQRIEVFFAQKLLLSVRKYDPVFLSRIPDLGSRVFSILDPGVKNSTGSRIRIRNQCCKFGMFIPYSGSEFSHPGSRVKKIPNPHNNYLLTYDSYVPLYNRFHRGEWITRVSGGKGALNTPGPLNGTSEASAIWAQEAILMFVSS
jgi:hypothetical protein